MAKPVLYIKGYKLDHQKMRSQFSRRDDDWGDNYELGYYDPIITLIPETAYKATSTSEVEWNPTAS